MSNKWENLYHKVNLMMCELGAEGTISTRTRQSSDVMDALFDIDGGAYNEELKLDPTYSHAQAIELGVKAVMECEEIFIQTTERLNCSASCKKPTLKEVISLLKGG